MMRGVLKGMLYVAGVLAFLAYLFWRTDIVPEAASPVIGYIDDAVVAIVVIILVRKLKKRLGLED